MRIKLIAVLVVVTLIGPNALASSLLGKSCPKQASTKVVKGQTFKCLKKNGKLVWTLTSKTPSVKPTPTPRPSSSTNPTPVPTSSNQPTPSPTQTNSRYSPTGEPFKSSEYPNIGKYAKSLVLEDRTRSSSGIEVSWDPTTTSAKREFLGKQIATIEQIYGPLIPKGSSIRVIVMGANKEWSRAQLRELSGTSDVFWNDYNNKFVVSTKCAKPNGFVEPDNKYPDEYTTYRGLGGGISPGKAFAFVTMSNCDNYIENDILFHEVFHSVQFLNSYVTAPYLDNRAYGWGLMPPWMREGQAQYFGMRMSENFSNQSVVFDNGGAIWWNIGSRWKTEYEYLQTYQSSDPYWAGAIMYEYLLAKFGLEKTLEVFNETVKKDRAGNLDEVTRFEPFDKTFLEIFGQTRQSFFEEVKPYIQWSLDQKPRS